MPPKTDSQVKTLVRSAIDRIEAIVEQPTGLQGLSTGFRDLDLMTCGLLPGDLIVIGSRPSLGKTSLAACIAENVALEQNLPVGWFSLEMTAESLVMRMLSARARVSLRNIRDGFLPERDLPKLTTAAAKIANSSIFIDDNCGMTVEQLKVRAKDMVNTHALKLIVVDYLGLLRTEIPRQNRYEEMVVVTQEVKALAMELRIPIIACAQLNREIEKERFRKPRLWDLRDSGDIEECADVVALLHRPPVEDEDAYHDESAVPMNLVIAKQRNGPTGDISLVFMKNYMRFESPARVSGADIP